MGSLDEAKLPYWHVNVPDDQRAAECPEFLRTVNAKDLGIITTPDSEYRLSTWPEVQKLILTNRIDLFQRVPSELRKYLEYTWKLKRDHGSVMDFILTQRLRWDMPIVPKGRPFEYEEDMKILWNDWPYGIDSKIVHIVVWTKFALEDDPATDDLTEEARAEIDVFVRKTFGSRVSADHYIWFKNWRSLKSIQAVEHFHVMLYDPDPAFVEEITNGDVPLIRKV
ncbi:hypothetical protein SAMD00023353_2701230 [Rosellinia necatrix]|uniref:N-acetylglucosamine-induced protein 1 n=1 Tax=Rosellinia necatrix TaxID=77044 RepID=A0A1W2TGP9_ROSNE|nr:hypothetical protein SAMD00023353_2701230 [Rosellinia necatrix]